MKLQNRVLTGMVILAAGLVALGGCSKKGSNSSASAGGNASAPAGTVAAGGNMATTAASLFSSAKDETAKLQSSISDVTSATAADVQSKYQALTSEAANFKAVASKVQSTASEISDKGAGVLGAVAAKAGTAKSAVQNLLGGAGGASPVSNLQSECKDLSTAVPPVLADLQSLQTTVGSNISVASVQSAAPTFDKLKTDLSTFEASAGKALDSLNAMK
ncbi:MAG: hypothetical protein HKL96_01070 [Phycisphaerales bacterium]|nr:hypothetical protein [Phycisphaerales bacterium]